MEKKAQGKVNFQLWKLDDRKNGRGKHSDKMETSIFKNYRRLKFVADKLLQQLIIAKNSEIVPFHENIQKNWKNRTAVITKNGI